MKPIAACSALLIAACADGAIGPPRPVATLIVPDSAIVLEDDSIRLNATMLDSAGSPVIVPVAWAVEDSTIASIDQRGMLRFGRPGATRAVALAGGMSRVVRVTSVVRYAMIASGTEFRGFMRWCGVTTKGRVLCLGSGNSLEISEDTFTTLEVPPSGVRTLSVGYEHACAVANDGAAWCWGLNDRGQLGVDSGAGTFQLFMKPVRVAGGDIYRGLDAGSGFTCGVTTAGVVRCWGSHRNGTLGDGDSVFYGNHPSPVTVSLPKAADTVVAGGAVACALLVDHTAWCWGANSLGSLGIGHVPPLYAWAPVPVASAADFRALTAGAAHACGLTSSGATLCWGSNSWNQIGTPPDTTCSAWRCVLAPTPLPGAGAFTEIGTGNVIGFTNGGVSCGLTAAGTIYCLGANRSGEVGIGSTVVQTTPALVAGPTPPFAAVSVGDFHACGLTHDGVAWCWGYRFGLVPTRLPYQP